MSIIVEFFMAPDDTAAASVLLPGPRRSFESRSFGNFDPEEAVAEWECLLSGGRYEDLVEAGEPRLVAGQDGDGCVVLVLSPRLFAALAAAEPSELTDAAVSWTERRSADGEVIDTEIAEAILTDLAGLARGARRHGQGVYCWVC